MILAKFVIGKICFCVTSPIPIQALHLEKHALGLFPVELDVLDDKHPDQGKGHHGSAADDHVLLSKGVRLLNCKACLGTLRVTELQVQVFVDALPIWQSLFGQETLQRTGKCALPDRATDGAANRTANIAEDTKECERTSGVLVIRSCKDSDLLYDDHSATSEREEDLTHDEVADFLVGLAEVNHKTLAEHVKGYGPVQNPAEAASLLIAKPTTKSQTPDTTSKIDEM